MHTKTKMNILPSKYQHTKSLRYVYRHATSTRKDRWSTQGDSGFSGMNHSSCLHILPTHREAMFSTSYSHCSFLWYGTVSLRSDAIRTHQRGYYFYPKTTSSCQIQVGSTRSITSDCRNSEYTVVDHRIVHHKPCVYSHHIPGLTRRQFLHRFDTSPNCVLLQDTDAPDRKLPAKCYGIVRRRMFTLGLVVLVCSHKQALLLLLLLVLRRRAHLA